MSQERKPCVLLNLLAEIEHGVEHRLQCLLIQLIRQGSAKTGSLCPPQCHWNVRHFWEQV